MIHSNHHAPNQAMATLVESLSVMVEQESTTYSCLDYLNGGGNDIINGRNHHHHECASNSNKITPDDRMKIVDWCYRIVDRYQLNRETVAVAMNIVDRFVCINAGSPQAQDALYHRGKYQLVAVTALYMSIKVNECVAFGVNDFVAMSHGTYSADDIKDMEWEILQGLSWRVCPPTSLQVGNHILALMIANLRERKTSLEQGTWLFVCEEVAFQVEVSVRKYYFTTQRPSTIAIATILNAIDQADDHDYKLLMLSLLSILQDFDFELSKLKEVMDNLLCMVNENPGIGDLNVLETNPEDPEESEALGESCDREDNSGENEGVKTSVNSSQASESFHSSFRDVASTDNCTDFYTAKYIE